jgi:arylsulfatase A-like enzyme
MNDTPILYLAPHKTFTEVLADNGYECGLSGKWHVGGADVPQAGFTFWKTLAMGGAEYYHQVALEEGEMRMKHGVYVTDYITDGAMEFLDQRDSDKPFCLCVHYTAPHSPWGEGCHPEEYMSLYRGNPFRSIPEEPPHPWVHGVDQSFAEWKSKPHPGVRFVKAQYDKLFVFFGKFFMKDFQDIQLARRRCIWGVCGRTKWGPRRFA